MTTHQPFIHNDSDGNSLTLHGGAQDDGHDAVAIEVEQIGRGSAWVHVRHTAAARVADELRTAAGLPAADQALEAQAAGDALTEFAEKLSARIPDGSPTEVHEDVIGVILELREEAAQKNLEAAFLRSTAGQEPTDSAPDTLPAWLHQRFGTRGRYGQSWDALSDDDRAYWEHQARAVRRAVARNGFKEA